MKVNQLAWFGLHFMELRLLRTFKAVAEAGSFTNAASRIHLTQAAVSVHIRQLEEEIGTPLFLRVNKKLFLTEAGRALLSHAESILRAHDEAKAELAALGGPSRARMHIGVASTAITVHPLPEILSEIKRRYALLDLSVIGGTSEWIIEQILAGNIDAGLVSLPVENTDVATETLRTDKLVAVMSPQHRLARARVITAEQLTAEPLILGEKGGNTRRLIDLFFEKHDLHPNIVMELQRTEAIIKMVELGFGVTILPQKSVSTDVARGRVRTVAVRDLNLKWEFGVAYLKSDYHPPALESFLKLCRAYLGNESAQSVVSE
ncbi:MAG TPA: LysR family transcriptional regulator [Blastocatellia bacterium]|nr:LysR family transcriptional regulator [Blastocatellia bacterium]